MRKNLLGVFTLFILSLPSFYAQAPATWVVNPSAYNNSMTVTAVLNMSSVESRDTQDVVAAFIGSEVRGVGSAITPIVASNRYIAYFVIYSNDLNELVTFKLYNRVTNKVTSSVTLPIKFIADGNVGTFVDPLVIKDNNVPTDLTMSNLTIQENKPASSLVGTLNVVDEDLADTHVFTFLDGVGFEDNTAFEIFNGAIYAKSSLDFEAKSSYTIRIQAEDSKMGKIVKTFQITVVDDALPTVFTLSKNETTENLPVNSVIGDFNVAKENKNVFDLTLVSGSGGDDNASFEIVNNQLRNKAIFDFETKSIYKIRVQATNAQNDVLLQTFEITVKDDNLPTVFALSKVVIDENKPVGSVVGDFTVVKEDRSVFALSLIDGAGAEDNASFEIIANALKVKSIFDFEAKSTYRIRVKAFSTRGDILEQAFEITVKDDNLPTVFALSKVVIDENKPVGSVVGDFTVVKEDRSVFALSLVDGDGAEDNASFEIIGNALKVKSIFDFEAKSTYRIRVKAVSTRGDVLEQSFEITVKDDNLPTVFALSKVVIDENKPVGSVVGDFTVVKEDRSVFALSLVDGDGAEDNASFEIIGNALKVISIFDFEAKSTYRIRVKAVSTRGDILEQSFEITVKDDNLPTVFALSKVVIDENKPVGSVVGDFTVVKEDRSVFALSLIDGAGAEDNASFEIIANALKVKSIFDFEAKSAYRIRVKAVSTRGDILEQTFEITVKDDNLPTVFSLSKDNIDENLVVGTIIGDFVIVKENRNNFNLSLSDGVGGEDNASFELVGSALKSKLIYDFEDKKSFRLRIKAENTIGDVLYANFVIHINDVNDAPVLITSTNYSIKEDFEIGGVVGVLTTKDQDPDVAKYSFLNTGSDYKYFQISGNELLLKQRLDYETQKSFQFDLVSNDGRGGEVTQTLLFTVFDVNENPVILNANANNLIAFSISELDPKDTIVGKIEITDQDKANGHTYKIVSDEKLPFAIDVNGVVNLVGAVDYEKKTKYSFQVVVTDNGTPQLNDAVNVEIEIKDEIEAKLAFNNFVSPNNDGKNDFLVIENIQLYKDYNLSIYNVRGQLVFSVVQYENNWSGEGLSQGEYYLYFIGKNSNNEEFIYKEVINLVVN